MGWRSRAHGALFDAALVCYPRAFRARFAAPMRQAYVDRLGAAPAGFAMSWLALRASANTAVNGFAERHREWRRRRRAPRGALARDVRQDLQFAVRMLRRRPATSGLAVLILAIGITATATVFALVDVALLRPVPLPGSDRLVTIAETLRGQGSSVSLDNLVDWQAETRAFEAITAMRPQSVNLTGEDPPERVRGGFVTSAFFQVAGVPVALGRPLVAADDVPGAPPVVVINDTFWRRRFDRAADVLGRVVQLNNVGFQIVGVMPPGFVFPFDGAEVWLPVRHSPGTFSRNNRNLFAFGRLREHVTAAQGQADLAAIASALARAYPDANVDRAVQVTDLHQWLTADSRDGLSMVLALVLVLLAAAVANAASLQVGAMSSRRSEIAVRLALGAGRGRLVRQLLMEQLVVAAAAGAMGLLLMSWLLPAAVSAMPAVLYGIDRVSVDARVVLFTVAVTIGSGFLAGLVPAWQWATRADGQALRGANRAIGDRGVSRTRDVLVAAQVSMAAVLLACSGLLVKSYLTLLAADPGFRAERVVTMEYRLPANKYVTSASQAAFHEAVVERVRALAGVKYAAVARALPLSGNGDIIGYRRADDAPTASPHPASLNTVTDDYFRTLGIPLIKGRTFDRRDTADAPLVAVVSERFARAAWPDADPIGQTIVVDGSDKRPQVIGVVGDLRQFNLSDDPQEALYGRNVQNPGLFMTLAAQIDGAGDPMARVADLRRAVWSVDRDQPVWKERTLAFLVDKSLQASEFLFTALAIFAVSALMLVVGGLYGVISQTVSRRSSEIGLRIALGASRAGVVREVLSRGVVLTVGGLGFGLVAAVAASKLLAGLLYRTSTLDAWPYLGTTLVLAAVALTACYWPARRAAAIDPALTLRDS